MKQPSTKLCPCCSEQDYSTCCEPLHLGKSTATTPEKLMRSRYAAFAKREIDYLIKTTHSSLQHTIDKTSLSNWSQENSWDKLEVISSSEKVDKGLVEFKAYFHTNLQKEMHHELSEFTKENDNWLYSKGTINPKTNTLRKRNDPCPCGSGKKNKKCCG